MIYGIFFFFFFVVVVLNVVVDVWRWLQSHSQLRSHGVKTSILPVNLNVYLESASHTAQCSTLSKTHNVKYIFKNRAPFI
jgi:hypothetical protein